MELERNREAKTAAFSEERGLKIHPYTSQHHIKIYEYTHVDQHTDASSLTPNSFRPSSQFHTLENRSWKNGYSCAGAASHLYRIFLTKCRTSFSQFSLFSPSKLFSTL